MAKKMDPRLLEILQQYGENPEEALWDCHGTWVAYHKAIERIATKAGVSYADPKVLVAQRDAAAILVTGNLGDKVEWSIGEAAIDLNYRVSGRQAAYPFAMAEKRAKDRVVLKLIGLHGLVYSEEESDDFRNNPPAPPAEDETYPPPPRKENGKPETGWREDGSRTSFWLKASGTADELKAQLLDDARDCHTLKQLEELKAFYRGKARELKFNKAFLSVLTEEFDRIEHAIMEAMDAAELAEVPLKDALQHSLPRETVKASSYPKPNNPLDPMNPANPVGLYSNPLMGG